MSNDTCDVTFPVNFTGNYEVVPVDGASTVGALKKMGVKDKSLDKFVAIAEASASYFA